MKKVFSLLLLLATTMALFLGCDKDEQKDQEQKYYFTEKQKTVLSSFHGTFAYTLEIVNSTTKIEFIEQYNPPKDIYYPEQNKTYEKIVQGKFRIIYDNGLSFEKYYFVDGNATRMMLLTSLDNLIGDVYDFQYINENQFKIKNKDEYWNWDVYNRVK